jgi:MscS family membrane protein
MLEQEIYGNTLQNWGISLLIIAGALIVNQILIFVNRKVIRKMTAKSSVKFGEILFGSLEKPLLMGIILLAVWIALDRLDLGEKIHGLVFKSYNVLVVLNVTWFFARLCASLVENIQLKNKTKSPKGKFYVDHKITPLVKRGVLIIVWIIGIITALNNVGIEVTTLMGALGIGGIAFALAAQDTIKNIFGGITMFTDKTFHIGDVINFDSTEGTVIDIGLRSTRLRTYDRRIVTIPNYKLMDALITNVSSETARRIVMDISLRYDTPPEKMQEAMAILRAIPHHISTVNEKDLDVAFTEFAQSALVIRFIYFINKTADISETRSKVNFEILTAFNQSGLKFAFPSSTVYLQKPVSLGSEGLF